MDTHTVDQDTGEYLGGPEGTGAPYRIDGRTPYRITHEWGGFCVRWFENMQQACRQSHKAAESAGWVVELVEHLTYSEYMQGRTRSPM